MLTNLRMTIHAILCLCFFCHTTDQEGRKDGDAREICLGLLFDAHLCMPNGSFTAEQEVARLRSTTTAAVLNRMAPMFCCCHTCSTKILSLCGRKYKNAKVMYLTSIDRIWEKLWP